MTGMYPEEEFMENLRRVAGGEINEPIARLSCTKIRGTSGLGNKQGIQWQPALSGTLHLGRTNIFQLGGGKAVMNSYYQTAKEKGVEVWYDSMLEDIEISGTKYKAAKVRPKK